MFIIPMAQQASSPGVPDWVPITALVFSGISLVVAIYAVRLTRRNVLASDPRIKLRVNSLEHKDGRVFASFHVVNTGRVETHVGPFYIQYPRGFGIARRERFQLFDIKGPSSKGWDTDGGILKGMSKVTCQALLHDHAEDFAKAERIRPYYLPGSRVRIIAELGTGEDVRSWKQRITPRMLRRVDRERTAYEAALHKEPTWQEELGIRQPKIVQPKRQAVSNRDKIAFSVMYLVIIGLGVTAFTVLSQM